MDYNFYDSSSNSWPYAIQAAGNKYSVAITRTTSFSWELHGGGGAPICLPMQGLKIFIALTRPRIPF